MVTPLAVAFVAATAEITGGVVSAEEELDAELDTELDAELDTELDAELDTELDLELDTELEIELEIELETEEALDEAAAESPSVQAARVAINNTTLALFNQSSFMKLFSKFAPGSVSQRCLLTAA
jgi:hypothetical protein